jgi:hypothetical protein
MLLILLLLLAAWLRWRSMVGELDAMTRQLRVTAAEQRRLQQRLQETHRLLEKQKRRLRALEAKTTDSTDQGEVTP